MKLTITKTFACAILLAALSGCGAFSDETKLEIQMYGIARAPETATGDRDPQFQTYEFTSISLLSAEGDFDLLEEAESFKIVDRPQIILDKDMNEQIGKAYTGINVVLSPDVVGGDSQAPELSFTLSNPTLALEQAIDIEEGKSKTITVKLIWANTIGSEAMTEPSFEITVN